LKPISDGTPVLGAAARLAIDKKHNILYRNNSYDSVFQGKLFGNLSQSFCNMILNELNTEKPK